MKIRIALLCLLITPTVLAGFLKVKTLANPFQGDLDGALYYRDFSNAFHNPAELAFVNKSMLYYQDGQAGYIERNGSTMYGAYYGRSTSAFNTIVDELNYDAAGISESDNNPIKLLYSHRSRTSAWGVSFDYQSETASTLTQTGDETASVIKLSAGYSKLSYDVFINFSTFSGEEAATGGQKLDAGSEIVVGGKLRWFGMRNYLIYKTTGYDVTTTTNTDTVASSTIILGTGKKVNFKGKPYVIYYSGSVRNYSSERTTTTSSTESSTFQIPLQFGAEYKLLSWLTIRAGGAYNLIDNSETKSGTSTQTDAGASKINPRIGAHVHYKSFDLDFVYGDAMDQSLSGSNALNESAEVSLSYSF